MKNLKSNKHIILELEDLIAETCTKNGFNQSSKTLHISLIEKHYNAANVSIDYHRRRVEMNLLYTHEDSNMFAQGIHANLWYRDLCDFLKSCVDSNPQNLVFYANLIQSCKAKKKHLMSA